MAAGIWGGGGARTGGGDGTSGVTAGAAVGVAGTATGVGPNEKAENSPDIFFHPHMWAHRACS